MKIAALLLCLFCAACTAKDVDKQTKFALDAIQDNVLSTDFSALVEITGTSIKELSNADSTMDKDELVAIHYTARVLENFLATSTTTNQPQMIDIHFLCLIECFFRRIASL